MLKKIIAFLFLIALTVLFAVEAGSAANAESALISKTDLDEDLYTALLGLYNKARPERLSNGDPIPSDAFAEDTRLPLSGMHLTSLKGMDLFDLGAIQELTLSENYLTSCEGLPADLPGLKLLNLSDNLLCVTDGLSAYPSLTELNLSGNALTNLNGFPSFSSLKILDVSENEIHNFSAMSYCPKLIELDLSRNGFTDASLMFAPENTPALNYLDISDNALADLAAMPNYTSLPLRICDADGNTLTTVAGLEKFKNPSVIELKIGLTGNPVVTDNTDTEAMLALANLGIVLLSESDDGEPVVLNPLPEEPINPDTEEPAPAAPQEGLPVYAIILISVGSALLLCGAGVGFFFFLKHKKGIKTGRSVKNIVLLIIAAAFCSLLTLNIAASAAEEEISPAAYLYSVTDASQIENGDITIIFNVEGAQSGYHIITQGLVYSSVNTLPVRGGGDVIEMEDEMQDNTFYASSQALEENTLYYVRLYGEYRDTGTVYSEVVTYRTPSILETGESVGCDIITGAKYYKQSINFGQQSSLFASLDSGYTAYYKNRIFTDYLVMTSSGENVLVTEDTATGEKYLHYFTAFFGDEPVEVQVLSFSCHPVDDTSDYHAQFEINIATGNFNQHIQEWGILEGDSWKLAAGAPEVEKHDVSTTNADITYHFLKDLGGYSIGGTRYFRGFAKVGGNYYYSPAVYRLDITEGGTTFYTTDVIEEYQKQWDTLQVYAQSTLNINGTLYDTPGEQIHLNQNGQYFITRTSYATGTPRDDNWHLVIDHSPTELQGVENYYQYRYHYNPATNRNDILEELNDGTHTVNNVPPAPFIDDYNCEMYLSWGNNDENTLSIGNGVSLAEEGYYKLNVVTPATWDIYSFSYFKPFVTTNDNGAVAARKADISASFFNNGSVLERGFLFSSTNSVLEPGETGVASFIPDVETSTSYLSATIGGLEPETLYRYRAYIKYGTEDKPLYIFGQTKSFITSALSAPTLTTGYPSDITNRSMVIHATILDDGGAQITDRGVVYSQDPNPEIGAQGSTRIAATVTSSQDFPVFVNGLNASTLYYFRAYAINAIGTAYGETAPFITDTAYTVTFNLDGGTRTGGGTLTQSGVYGFTPIAPVAEKTGFEFCGWDTDFRNVTGSITVTAVWLSGKMTRIVFDPNGGTRTGGGELSQILQKGFTAEAPVLEFEGYDFDGWDKSLNNIESYTVITALWSIKRFQVYFDLAGGTRTGGGTLAQSVEYGTAAEAPVIEYSGHTFLGWDKSFDNITEITTVTALWDIHKYTVTFTYTGWNKTGGGADSQQIAYGSPVTPPIIQREGYDFLCWSGDITSVISGGTLVPVWARMIPSTTEWTTDLWLSVDYSHPGMAIETDISGSYDVFERSSSQNIRQNITVNGRCVFGGTTYPLTPLVIANIDNTLPETPSFSFFRNQIGQIELSIEIGEDGQSGIQTNQYCIGKSGTWIDFSEDCTLSLSKNTHLALRSYDKAGNMSRTISEYIKIFLINTDGEYTVRSVISTEDDIGSQTTKKISLSSEYNMIYDQYFHYTSYHTGDPYKGCGPKAAQIFMEWFGVHLPLIEAKNYVETTDFGYYLDWMSDVWDPGIFSTPAQLDSGLQSIFDDYLPDMGYNVVRHSPESSVSAIAMIESYLSHGYPVIILDNDGGHWEVISDSDVTRDRDGGIVSARFFLHDNAGGGWRSWESIDYFFEDNFNAEAARAVGYTSYVDTIMSVVREKRVHSDNWSSGWTSSEFFRTGGNDYLFLLKQGNGLVHVNNVNDDGSIGTVAHVFDWSAGWSEVSFYYDSGETYMVLFKNASDLIHIRKMNEDGSYGSLTYEGTLFGAGKNFLSAKAVKVKDTYYLYTSQKQDNGTYNNRFYSLSGNAVGGIISNKATTDKIQNAEVYTAGSASYLVNINDESRLKIYALGEDGVIGDLVKSESWSEGWSVAAVYSDHEKCYLLIAKSGAMPLGFGADADGIMRIHELTPSGEAGVMTDSAYWDVSANMLLDFGYTNIRFYQNSNGETLLFAMRAFDGKVKILKMNDDGMIDGGLY